MDYTHKHDGNMCPPGRSSFLALSVLCHTTEGAKWRKKKGDSMYCAKTENRDVIFPDRGLIQHHDLCDAVLELVEPCQ